MTGRGSERDFRKWAPTTQAELRRIAVAMVKAGKTRNAVNDLIQPRQAQNSKNSLARKEIEKRLKRQANKQE